MPDTQHQWPAAHLMVWGYACIILFVGGVIIWATQFVLASAIIVSGRIAIQDSRQIIQHRDGGTVVAVSVKEGQQVSDGQVLLRLDPSELRYHHKLQRTRLYDVLARISRLQAERDGLPIVTFPDELLRVGSAEIDQMIYQQERFFSAKSITMEQQMDQLAQNGTQLQNQLAGLTAQHQALQTQLAITEEELSTREALRSKGLSAQTSVLELRRQQAQAQGHIGAIRARIAETQSRITQNQLTMQKISSDRRENAIRELQDLRHNELEIREHLHRLDLQLDRLDIKSPVEGIIYGLEVHGAGAVIEPAHPIMFVIPQNRPMVIEARVPAKDVDRVFVKQLVRLRFPTLDSNNTPELSGEVAQISADTFTDTTTDTDYYRVDMVLLHPGDMPPNLELRPGMPVEAHLRTGDQTPFIYLTKPLADYFARAFQDV